MKTFWELSHDERAELAKNDSSAFEELYKAEATKLGPRAEARLWSEQAKLGKIKNSLVRAQKAQGAMFESFTELKDNLAELKDKLVKLE